MANKMTYQEARRIRNTGFGDLIAQNIALGGGIGSSVGKAVSQRFKSKVTGIKESFDPLNIAKKLTGNVGAAILGKLTGRKLNDIRYFAGGKRFGSSAGVTQESNLDALQPAVYTKVSEGQRQRLRKGDSATDVLAKLYNLMKRSYESEEKRREIDINFKFKQEKQKEKWHKELLELIIGSRGGTGSTTYNISNTKPSDNGGIFAGIGDLLKNVENMISKAINGLKELINPIIEFVSKVGVRVLGALASFLLSNVGLALLGIGATVYLAAWLSDLLKKAIETNVSNMSALSPEEAANALKSGSSRDIQALGGREKLEEIVRNGQEKAKELLKDPVANKQAIIDAGGEDKLRKIANGPTVEMPTPRTETQLANVPPRPDTTGGKNKQRALDWDRKFEWTHNPDGTPIQKTTAKPLPSGVEESTAESGRSGKTASRMDPRRVDLVTPDAGVTTAGGAYVGGMHGAKRVPDSMSGEIPKSTSATGLITPNALTKRVQSSIEENNNLRLDDSKPKVINIDKSSNLTIPGGGGGSNGVVLDSSVDVRIDDPTLLKAQKQSIRPV